MNDVLGSDFKEGSGQVGQRTSDFSPERVKAALNVNVKTVEGALYASQSNRVAESAVKDVKDAVKTNLAWLFTRFGREFKGGHRVLP